ncbi:hypothetical protein B375_0206280 [Xylella fastidiosa 6c]|nr:hypothetical protein B375_0206280 [Xylella fastidiosa 6c]
MTECSSNTACLAQATVIPFPWLRRLWERMIALYGNTWVSAHGESAQREDGTLTAWIYGLASIRPHAVCLTMTTCWRGLSLTGMALPMPWALMTGVLYRIR